MLPGWNGQGAGDCGCGTKLADGLSSLVALQAALTAVTLGSPDQTFTNPLAFVLKIENSPLDNLQD